ncbi:MAG: hypothetical protein ACREC9_06905 [Methylocella sp.]
MLSYSSPFADYSYVYDARNRLALSSSGAILLPAFAALTWLFLL